MSGADLHTLWPSVSGGVWPVPGTDSRREAEKREVEDLCPAHPCVGSWREGHAPLHSSTPPWEPGVLPAPCDSGWGGLPIPCQNLDLAYICIIIPSSNSLPFSLSEWNLTSYWGQDRYNGKPFSQGKHTLLDWVIDIWGSPNLLDNSLSSL